MCSRTSRLRTSVTAPLLGVALLAACAPRVRPPAAGSPVGDSVAVEQTNIAIVVENHNSDNVVVTVVSAGGQTQRLGTVAGNAHATFAFSERFAAASRRLVLIAHPVGARRDYRSESFTVQRGQSVAWQLQNGFSGSSVSVY